MNKVFNILLLISVAVGLASCGASPNNDNPMITENKMVASDMAYDSAENFAEEAGDQAVSNDFDTTNMGLGPQKEGRKIERFYDYFIETTTYEEDHRKLIDLVDKYNGYIDSSNLHIDRGINNDENLHYFNASVKIPIDSSEKFNIDLRNVGQTSSTSNYSNDLTKTYTDVNIRLDSKKKELDKLNDLMDKANNIDDTMAIQARILEVQSEIDEINANLRDLDNRVAYDTFNISLNEVYSYNPNANRNPNFWTRLQNAFKDSIHIFVSFIQDLIIALASLWPLVLIVIGLVYFLSKKYKKAHKLDTTIKVEEAD